MSAFVSASPGFNLSLHPNNRIVSERNVCKRQLRGCVSTTATTEGRLPLLELRDVTYRLPNNFDVHLFRRMNFKVFPNEFVLLIGENGAGKSTVINIMTGLIKIKPRNGTMLWNGKVTKPKHMLDHIGLVLQDPVNYFFMPTVLDELIVGRPDRSPNDVRDVMAAVGLQNISLLSDPRSLSGGQVRRLAIADQLMRDPRPTLFALDEPLAGVDWTGRREIADLLGSLKKQFAVVIVSHEPGELLEYADRVVEVGRGGTHEVDPEIVAKAIEIRAERRTAVRAKARREALEYSMKQSNLGT